MKALQMHFTSRSSARPSMRVFAPVALLHADVHLRLIAAFLIGVREGVQFLLKLEISMVDAKESKTEEGAGGKVCVVVFLSEEKRWRSDGVELL